MLITIYNLHYTGNLCTYYYFHIRLHYVNVCTDNHYNDMLFNGRHVTAVFV